MGVRVETLCGATLWIARHGGRPSPPLPPRAWAPLSATPSSSTLSLGAGVSFYPGAPLSFGCEVVWVPSTSLLSISTLGSTCSPEDVEAAGLQHLGRTPSFKELRNALRCRLAQKISNKEEVLTILGGDFNYVTDASDRRCTSSATSSGGRDGREETHWGRAIEVPHGLHELHQPEMTYSSPNARSRLDRIYCNQSTVENFDRKMVCAALEWHRELSRHRAISFRRTLPKRSVDEDAPLPEHVLDNPEWPHRVALAWQDLLAAEADPSSLRTLVCLKKAMRTAARNLSYSAAPSDGPASSEDRLGVTMKFLRCSEGGFATGVSQCILRYPLLKDLVDNPYAFDSNHGRRLRLVRLHAIELAKDHAMDELNKLHDDLKELSEEQAMRRRQRNQRLLTRLAPGRTCSNFALADRHGHVCTDPEHIAGVLREHWSEVFKRKDTDSELRNRWLAEEARQGDPDVLRHVPQADVPFEMFEKAIRLTSNSSPGPDGLPFKAWRKLGRFAAVALYDAFVTISGPDGQRILEEDWDSFNESNMVFLPKKASGRTEDGSDIFTPNNMRPLNITNTDNRIMCSAMRLHIEPSIAPGVSMAQRGFIKGRSMLSNIVDIEEAMLSSSLTQSSAAAVFFDFEAAFPSVSQEFLLEVLAARGWPPWRTRFSGLFIGRTGAT